VVIAIAQADQLCLAGNLMEFRLIYEGIHPAQARATLIFPRRASKYRVMAVMAYMQAISYDFGRAITQRNRS
jgi:hypothetical protein